MTTAQFVFSLGSGLAVLTAGAALATNGQADWGLFWVGSMIAGLTVATHLQSNRSTPVLTLTGALPAPEQAGS